ADGGEGDEGGKAVADRAAAGAAPPKEDSCGEDDQEEPGGPEGLVPPVLQESVDSREQEAGGSDGDEGDRGSGDGGGATHLYGVEIAICAAMPGFGTPRSRRPTGEQASA